MSRTLVDALGKGAGWLRYIAAWNWCNVAQYLLLVVASIPGLLGVPGWADQACQLIALGWALWLEWFAARIALNVSPLAAAGLVAVDLGLGLFLGALGGVFGAV